MRECNQCAVQVRLRTDTVERLARIRLAALRRKKPPAIGHGSKPPVFAVRKPQPLAQAIRVLDDAHAHGGKPAHRIAFYLYDLAAEFHAFWNAGNDDPARRMIVADDAELTRARLFLAAQMGQIVANGLAILGVAAVEEM